MKLEFCDREFYRVKRGQTLEEIACAFGVPPRALARCNDLTQQPGEGYVLKIPPRGNLYTVRGGESKTLLCGSPRRYEERNGTRVIYPAQVIVL